jgi:hypothetical protein
MIRSAVVAVLFACALGAALGADKDPVKDKLLTARATYDAEMKQVRKQVEDWLDQREATARRAGDKKAVDQIKAERAALEDDEVLPKSVPGALKQRHDQARKAMDAAYAEAVKEYTKADKSDEAASVETARKAFASKGAGPEPIDLLALVDTKAHAVAGEWKMDGKVLVIGSKPGTMARLQLPYEPPEEYDLEVRCKRTGGEECFGAGLVAGGSQVLALVDGWPPQFFSGFDLVDNKWGLNNDTTVKGQVLKSNVDLTFTYSVRAQKIETALNGKVVTSFKGEFNRLGLREVHRVPNKKALFLFTAWESTYQIDRIVVKPVKGKGTILK